MKTILKGLLPVALLFTTACVTFPVASTIVDNPGRAVSAEASAFSFLWLTPLPVETASELLQQLVDECGGAVTGVTTSISTGYAFIGQQERMLVAGFCADGSGGDGF